MYRFAPIYHDIYHHDDVAIDKANPHPGFFHLSGDVCLPSADFALFESSFYLHSCKHAKANVPPFPRFHCRTPLWFLSQFNSNFIFAKIKDDFVTRTLNQSKSAVRFVSHNEVVYSNNMQYFYFLVQVFILYFMIIAVFVIFEYRQICASNQLR